MNIWVYSTYSLEEYWQIKKKKDTNRRNHLLKKEQVRAFWKNHQFTLWDYNEFLSIIYVDNKKKHSPSIEIL